MNYRSSLVMMALVTSLLSSGCGDDQRETGATRITEGESGFVGPLRDNDWFGFDVASLGDFDRDGVQDLLVGAGFDDDGGTDRGAVWILLLWPDGTVRSEHKISDTAGGFGGGLDNDDVFGRSVTSIGDLDGDGVTDIAVGAREDDDGGFDRGAIWILFLAEDATVKAWQKISSTEGGFSGTIGNGDWFGISLTSLGDLDGDGVVDLAAGAIFDGGGAVWILFLKPDGTVKAQRRISGETFGATDLFGESVAAIGDVDGDGIVDLAVGELDDDDGGSSRGAVWILFLREDGSVDRAQKISATQGDFGGPLRNGDHFGSAVGALGDPNQDGVPDLVVGADLDDDGGSNRGALWLLFLRSDGTVRSWEKISSEYGEPGLVLQDEDRLGRSVARLDDARRRSPIHLAAGAIFDDAGGRNRGAVWSFVYRPMLAEEP